MSSPAVLSPAPNAASAPRICTRCVMDSRDPDITFDVEGRCNYCAAYLVRVAAEVHAGAEGEARLERLLERVRAAGKGRDYDCLIGLSGGVDSTMVAYHVKRRGLRPLAVHFDNGWNSELAADNIKRTLDGLKIDLVTHVVDWEEFRDLQLSFFKASVQNIEIPTDHGISALLYRTAAKYGLRTIITGGNVRTEGLLPLSSGYFNIDLRHLRAIHARFGSRPLRTFPQISLRRLAFEVLVRRVRTIALLNYVDYDKRAAIEILTRELGWRPYGGKHYESIFTRFFQGYILPRKFKYDKRQAHLSCLVLGGEMTREEALRELDTDPYGSADLRSDRAFVLKKLGLSEEAFEALMQEPPVHWSAYPNNYWLLGGFPRLKRAFVRVAKSL